MSIPVDWEIKKLKNCCLNKGDYGINAAAVEYSDNLPTYLRITDIDDDGNYSTMKKVSVDDRDSLKFKLNKSDIVFVRTGATVGKSYLYEEKDGALVFAGFLIRFKANQKILLPQFIKYITNTKFYWDWVKTVSMRSGQPGINAEEYGSLKIPIPTLWEQKRIIDVLDSVTKMIDKSNQLISKKEKNNSWLTWHLLTGKKRLKGFNEEWQLISLGNFIKESRVPSKDNDVNKRITVKLNLKGIEKRNVRGSEAEDATYYFIRKAGQFIYGKQNLHKGALGIIPQELDGFESSQDIPTFDFYENIEPSFLLYFLSQENIHKSLEKISTGTGSKRIHPENLFKVKYKFPEKVEQIAIVKILDTSDKEIKLLKEKVKKLKEQKKGLMQVLLTGKKRLK